MFNNIGGKIKMVAKIVTWLGIIASFIYGFRIMNMNDESWVITVGLLVIAIGSLVSWISSFFMYGFGELIEGIMNLNEKMDDQISYVAAIDKKLYYQSEKVKSIERKLREDEIDIEQFGTCEMCEKENVKVYKCRCKNRYGQYTRKMCKDCIEKHNTTKQ